MKTTRPQSVNRKQVEQFLASAHNKAVATRKDLDIDAEAAYQIAYEAMLKGSLALMLSHGSRPRVQLGHHRAIIEFAQQHLDPKFAPTFALFDRMRRKRNDAFYDVALIADSEAKEAVATANQFLNVISESIAARLK
ncbi:MAG: hypothetical protein ACYCO5_07330 [Acidobacteriaceae bacterium]